MGKDVAGPTIKTVNNDTLVKKNVNNATTDTAPSAKNLVSEDPHVAVNQEVEIVDKVIKMPVHIGGVEEEGGVKMSNKDGVEEVDTQSNNEGVDKLNNHNGGMELGLEVDSVDKDVLHCQIHDYTLVDGYKWKD